jgi:hypothetical protein
MLTNKNTSCSPEACLLMELTSQTSPRSPRHLRARHLGKASSRQATQRGREGRLQGSHAASTTGPPRGSREGVKDQPVRNRRNNQSFGTWVDNLKNMFRICVYLWGLSHDRRDQQQQSIWVRYSYEPLKADMWQLGSHQTLNIQKCSGTWALRQVSLIDDFFNHRPAHRLVGCPHINGSMVFNGWISQQLGLGPIRFRKCWVNHWENPKLLWASTDQVPVDQTVLYQLIPKILLFVYIIYVHMSDGSNARCESKVTLSLQSFHIA